MKKVEKDRGRERKKEGKDGIRNIEGKKRMLRGS